MSSKGTSSASDSDTFRDPSELLINRTEARKKEMLNNKFLVAIAEKNIKGVNSLLNQIDINFRDQDGLTPLHWAIETGDMKMINLLLNNGAEISGKNNVVETPLDIARKMNRPDIVSILEESLRAVNFKVDQKKKVKEWDGQSNSSDDQENVWINPVHGYIYQLKLLMLFLHRGLSCKYSFRLGTEIKEAKKFDDLVFEYVEDNRKVYRLLQAKHKFDESKKITVDKLLRETKGDYSLVKYFHSFQACKKDNFFKDGIIKDVIICTNIDFDFEDLKNADIQMEKLAEKDDILDVKSAEKEPTRYKFTKSMVGKLKSKLKSTVSDYEIEDFLHHLIFAVNQPNEEELGQIVKEEISKEMGFLDTEKAYNKLLTKMMDLSLGKENGMFLSYQDGKKFFDDLKETMPVWFKIQNPVSSFTGRLQDLKKMHKMLTKNSYVCVSGMGGLGKTELIRKYIADYGDKYDNQIVWINAESYRTLVDSFQQLASDKLNIKLTSNEGKEKHITSIITDVYQFFSKNKSLFIFDNAEKYKCEHELDCGIDQFLPCLPDNCVKPKVIITSRNQKWPDSIKKIVLKGLTLNEAKQLVEKKLSFENDQEKELIIEFVEKLQFLPLALQQAIAYIKVQKEKLACIKKNFGISNYLDSYSRMTHELFDFNFSEDSDSNYNKSVFATWNITLNALKEKENGQDALDILNIIAYCLPENIPVEFLLCFSSNEKTLSAAIGLLKQYSIVSVQHKSISIHRVIQQVIRIKLQMQNNEVTFLSKTLEILDKNNVKFKNIDHVISIWTIAGQYSELFERYWIISNFLIIELSNWGRVEQAISIGNEVAKLLEASVECDEQVLLRLTIIKNNIATANMKRHEYEIGLKGLLEVLELQLMVRKPTDSIVLATKYNIYINLINLNRNEEALKSGYELIEGYRVNPKESYPYLLIIKSKMVILLTKLGQHKEALSLMQEVLEGQKKTLDDHHPDTLDMRGFVANALKTLNKTEESLKILNKVFIDQEAALPRNHPDTWSTKSSKAEILFKQKKYSEAMKILQELNDAQKEIFGENHPDVIDINIRIAMILKCQGKYEQALKIFKDVFEKQERILGPEHLETIVTQYLLADILSIQKKDTEAVILFKDNLNKLLSIIGLETPGILTTCRSILLYLMQQNEYDSALEYGLKVFKSSESFYGKNHPSTFPHKSLLGMAYTYTGDFEKAVNLFNQLLLDQESYLGRYHKGCQETRYNIAFTKVVQSKLNLGKSNTSRSVYKENLLELAVAANAKDEDGLTILHHAIDCDNEAEVVSILAYGAEVFVTSNKGNTPLHIAVLKGTEKYVELLLQKVKSEQWNDFVDAKTTSSGSTALHVAAKMNHFDIVKCLLKNRATFCLKNKDGKLPLDLATDVKVINILKMVHEMFENVYKGDTTVIKKLKSLSPEEFAAATSARNQRGSTLSQATILNKQKDVATAILKMIQKSKSK